MDTRPTYDLAGHVALVTGRRRGARDRLAVVSDEARFITANVIHLR